MSRGTDTIIAITVRTKAAVRELIDEAADLSRSLCPEGSGPTHGKLKGSIHVEEIAGGYEVVAGGEDIDYAGHVEWGTSPHVIVAHGKALHFQVGGKDIYVKRVHHPGTAPRPFMRPAAEFLRVEGLKKVATRLRQH